MSRVTLGDVATERKENFKGDKSDLPIVGLEHLVPSEIVLSNWDENVDNTFTKVFHAGDVLFGRRRAYLKKAAVAPFDGICSGDITVIEAKKNQISPALLPFVIQNDILFDYAVEKSAGSLSPRVKWEYLKTFEFELPNMVKQQELAKALWSIVKTKKAYQKLITATDKLVKSQFLGQFSALPKEPLGNYIEQIRGVSYKPKDLKLMPENDTYVLLRANNISSDGHVNFDEVQYVNKDRVVEKQLIRKGDIIMCGSSGSMDLVGKAAICPPEAYGMTFGAFCKLIRTSDKLLPDFIAVYFMTDEYRNKIRQLACGSNINNLKSKHLDNLEIPVPSLNDQEDFVAFKEQSDKSKFELERALKELTATYKRIIDENLG